MACLGNSWEDVPDSLLLEAIKKGNEEAWAELIRRHQGWLWLLLLSRYRGNDASAAEAMQEIWLKFYQAVSRMDRISVRSYLQTMVSNRSIDEWRKDERRGDMAAGRIRSIDESSTGGDGEERPLVEVVADPASLNAADRRLLAVRIDRALAGLNEYERLLLLARADGATLSELAKFCDPPVAETTVRRHLLGAQAKFKKLFDEGQFRTTTGGEL